MAPQENLNLVLRYFTTINGRLASFGNLSDKFSGKEIRDDAELAQIVEKLERDKYLILRGEWEEKTKEYERVTNVFSLTFDGEIFILNDGYVRQSTDAIRENNRLKKAETSQRSPGGAKPIKFSI